MTSSVSPLFSRSNVPNQTMTFGPGNDPDIDGCIRRRQTCLRHLVPPAVAEECPGPREQPPRPNIRLRRPPKPAAAGLADTSRGPGRIPTDVDGDSSIGKLTAQCRANFLCQHLRHRAARAGHRHAHADAGAGPGGAVDETQVHDVHAELRIVDAAQRRDEVGVDRDRRPGGGLSV